jgi:hypothetical protein
MITDGQDTTTITSPATVTDETMPLRLPRHQDLGTPVIRTDFTDPQGWERLERALETPVAIDEVPDSADHYDRAVHYVTTLSDEKFRGVRAADVLAAAPPEHTLPYGHLYLADAETFASDDLPLLGIDLDPDLEPFAGERAKPFRIPALHVASVEANVSIANLFFCEFHGFTWDTSPVYVAAPGSAVYEEFRQMDQHEE